MVSPNPERAALNIGAGKNREALEGAGRRAYEEAWESGMKSCPGLKDEGGSTHLHEDDDGRGHGDGGDRVHDDTERTVVAVGFEGVDMRHLHDRKQGQQEQAKNGRHREGGRFWPVTRPPFCLRWSKQKVRLLHQGYTEIRCGTRGCRYESSDAAGGFWGAGGPTAGGAVRLNWRGDAGDEVF